MHVGLVDFGWKGHHTPYVSLYGQHLVDHGHDVTFITDLAHERLDRMPSNGQFSVRTLKLDQNTTDPTSLRESLYEQYIQFRQIKRTLDVCRDVDPDLIHFLHFDRTQIPFHLASSFNGIQNIPAIGTLHRDAFTGDYFDGDLSWTQQVTAQAVSRSLASNKLSQLVVHTDRMQDRITQSVSAADTSNVRVLPAPTPEPEDTTPARARRELELADVDQPLLLFFGELRSEKGPDLLIEALRQIDQPVSVVFAGSIVDYTRRDFEEWQRAVPDYVNIVDHLGFIPPEDVNLYFSATDCLLLPYRRRRGISGPLRRAAMAGTPIIGPTKTDVGDIIHRNGLGETFEYGSPDSLRQTIESFDLPISEERRDRLQQYGEDQHWRTAGDELLELYYEVV